MTSASQLPRHLAVIMDGNGRWAGQRSMPRIAGHKAGVDAVREIVKACATKKIEVLTLFAFSSENWRRPTQEVNYLMNLFLTALKREAKKLHKQNIKLSIIGAREGLDEKLQQQIAAAESLTSQNTGLHLIIAANYGGHWDLVRAIQKIAVKVEQGQLQSHEISSDLVQAHLSLANLPEPDLFIRTSGEQRISNFMLWELAYTELYFTDVLWPDFSIEELEKALAFFAKRERRFGFTSEQLREETHA
jgi:undecaprenyl diphosphate synthase